MLEGHLLIPSGWAPCAAATVKGLSIKNELL